MILNKSGSRDASWVERETAACEFADARLARRFRGLLECIGDAMGQSIPMACQDWANTKAACRFFSNERVDEGAILAGHFQATADRFATSDHPILVLHDTTEFTFQRDSTEPIGITYAVNSGRDKAGCIRAHTVCGILMHSSLAVTCDGLVLGLTAVKFWSRKKFKGTAALKRKVNPTRVPIERRRACAGWRISSNLAQNRYDLIFREPLPLHLVRPLPRPDSNSSWRKISVAGQLD